MAGVQHSGGSVDVSSGTGFSSSSDKMTPVVQLKVLSHTSGAPGAATIQLRPDEARAIGLDLIAAASQAIADTLLRGIARREGTDSDHLVGLLREATRQALGDG